MRANPEFIDLCTRELTLCRVHRDETVAVLSAGDERPEYVDAFLSAALSLGASAYHVRLPLGSGNVAADSAGGWKVGATGLAGNRGAIEALKQADILIDLIFLLFSKEQLAIQEAGTRILTCLEPIDNLARLLPTEELRYRVEAAGTLLGQARHLRFTNQHGTDVTYQLGVYPVITEYGYTDTPGRWDHWPAGFLFTGGADDGIDGRVVIAPGDIVFPFKEYVADPITLTIERGRIIDIRGGVQADILRDYMASFSDQKAYGISHIGWGLNESARWSSLATDKRGMGMESRAFCGSVLFSTGPNQELGGTNDTVCHVDVPMRNCSLYLDGEPILLDGDLVVDGLKPAEPTAIASSP
jgi:2,5-dihydroxypyridine 5,6-dioxygenase